MLRLLQDILSVIVYLLSKLMQEVILHIYLRPLHKFIHIDIVAHFLPEVMDALFFLLGSHLVEWLPFALVDELL